jgi:hypothetical protein
MYFTFWVIAFKFLEKKKLMIFQEGRKAPKMKAFHAASFIQGKDDKVRLACLATCFSDRALFGPLPGPG